MSDRLAGPKEGPVETLEEAKAAMTEGGSYDSFAAGPDSQVLYDWITVVLKGSQGAMRGRVKKG